MIITDSAIHIWEPPTPEKPWAEARLRSKAHGVDPAPEFSAEDVLGRMAEAGVDRAILVPPTFAGSPNDYSFQAAAKYPDRFAVMASIHLNRPDGPEHLRKLVGQGALGVRVTFHHSYDESWVRDGTSDWFWPLAEKLNISVMFNGPTIHKDIAQLAQRHPGLRLIFDHMGVPKGIKDDKVGPAMTPSLELARFPNVFVKLTNIPTYSTQDYPFPALFPALKQMIETFGPRRCMWGTNLSSMLHHGKCTYPQAVTMFTEEMGFLSSEDLEWVMGRALAECLGWPVAAGLAAKKVA